MITAHARKRLARRSIAETRKPRRLRIEHLEQRVVLAGDVGFAEPVAFPVGDNPEGITAADLDGDGQLDLVTANFADNTVSVLTANGDGTFLWALHFPTGVSPTSATVADVDRDGRPDIITANFTANNVSVLYQLPDGSFDRPETFDTGVEPESVAAVDVDNDGNLDLIVPHTGSPNAPGGISILFGDADFGFQPAVEIGEGLQPVSVAVADLNGDGHLDIAAANGFIFGGDENNDVAILFGASNGTFGDPIRHAAGDRPRDIEAADVNGDDIVDLVTANAGSGDVSVLLGQGGGVFAAAVNYSAGQQPNALVLADLNGNGRLDIAVADRGSNDISVLVNRGDGTFVPQGRFASADSPLSIVAGNFNEDELADLAVVIQEPDGVLVFLNAGTGPDESIFLDGRGALYEQDFDLALGIDGAAAGVPLPAGWSAVYREEKITSVTRSFPAGAFFFAGGTYNVGREGSDDRALATAVVDANQHQELQLLAEVAGGNASAVRLAFDIEAWAVRESRAADPGEAALRVVLEADTGTGFRAVADFGRITTGLTLHPPPPIIGRELWKTDGSNVSLVADIAPGKGSSNPRSFVEFHNDLYFEVGDFRAGTLVKYDGTSVSNVAEGIRGGRATIFNDAIFVEGRDNRGNVLVEIDDTGASKMYRPPESGFEIWGSEPTEFNGELYFGARGDTAPNGGNEVELWKFDGSDILLVGLLNPESESSGPCSSSDPLDFTILNGELYFTAAGAYLGAAGCPGAMGARELWKLDRTVPVVAADIVPGRRGSNPHELTVFNNELYFFANDGITGFELWNFDGTSATQIADIRPGAEGAFGTLCDCPGDFELEGGGRGGQFTEFREQLFFVANDGTTGWELWKTDGTSVARVTDINPGAGDSVATNAASGGTFPLVYNDELYFVAQDGTNGYGLWKTDGVSVSLVADRNPAGDFIRKHPNPIVVFPFWPNLFIYNDELYFYADDGTSGLEIWKTNGTEATQVTDINFGPGDSVAWYDSFVTYNDELYFAADDGSEFSGLLDGNSPANRVHFDSGVIDMAIPVGAKLRLRFDARNTGSSTGYVFGVDNFEFRVLAAGDSNGDGRFDQTDIVAVLQVDKYLSGSPASFSEGDWNRDGSFDQLDIVQALQTNNYLQGPYALAAVRDNLKQPPANDDFAAVDEAFQGETTLGDSLEL